MRSVEQLMDLTGRVALVTGASGGIGRVVCETLAELGCDLVLLDRNRLTLEAQAHGLRQEYSIRAEFFTVDLEDERERTTACDQIGALMGRLDILINNAAFVGDSQLSGWAVPFDQQEMTAWRRAMEVNLTACFHLSQKLAPLLVTQGAGAIVNVASIYGVVGPDMGLYAGTSMGNPAAYAASKGGLVQLTRWLATALSPTVRVNCISPGGVRRGQPEEFIERYEARTPLQRMATEEDFKGAIAYLASDLSSYVTGQNLMIDGGWTAW